MQKPLRVLIFGATGMVGQGVLRACLEDAAVLSVQTVGRTPSGKSHPKLREIIHPDLTNYAGQDAMLAGFDACFFCLGVSSAGLSEADYTHATCVLTLAAAEALARINPGMVFVYVSGAGTDSTEQGRTMWARVKGKTENALLRLPLASYLFRPAGILPIHGERSRTRAYRIFYALTRPLWPVLQKLAPSWITTTEAVGRAMLAVARHGAPNRVIASRDIPALGA